MKFSELMERVRARGVVVRELRVMGQPVAATPWSDGSGGAKVDPEIRGVNEDSRKVKAGDLFVARGGTRVDGSKYIVDAVARGAVAVVGEMMVDVEGIASARIDNANLACAVLAHEVAGNPTAGMKVIAITGTKGKTTVAYLLRSVLKAAGHTVGMIGTVEIDDGKQTVPAEMTTPGSVELVELFSRMKANGVTHCVMEVSSHALHQHRVAGIDFAVAIFTNLTGDHLDYHKTMEEYAAAKAMLFEGLKEGAVAVVNGDDEWCERMVDRCRARVARVCVGREPPKGGWSAEIIEMSYAGMQLEMRAGWRPNSQSAVARGSFGGLKLNTSLVGRHNAANIVCAAAALENLALMKWIPNLARALGAPGRLQRVNSEGPFSVFVDYAHTHDALENVLTALRATMGSDSSGASAGDMLFTQDCARMGVQDREGGLAGDVPSPRQKHGTREGPHTGDASQSARAVENGARHGRLICLFGCGGDRDRIKRPKMAAIAERLADKVIVTSDNPRTENPAAIIDEICAGFSPGWKDAGKITVEPDRRAAIRAAIAMAQPGDVVLLAGKGHENYQIIGTTKHHFDDVEEAEATLHELFQHQDTKTPRPPRLP